MNRNNVLIGIGLHKDDVYDLAVPVRAGESHPSTLDTRAGGCAFNTAAGLSVAGRGVVHAGVRGADASGLELAAALRGRGIEDAGLVIEGEATGRYAALLEPDGSVAMAAAAMNIYERAEELAQHGPFRNAIAKADVVVLDANAPAGAVARLTLGRRADAMLVLLATSPAKVGRLGAVLNEADVLFGNEAEWEALEAIGRIPRLAFVTSGARGAELRVGGKVVARRVAMQARIDNVIGAGDAFAAGTLHAFMDGTGPEEAMNTGLDWAARCVASPTALGWLDDTFGRRARERARGRTTGRMTNDWSRDEGRATSKG